jgi:hypothetical protein
MQVFARLVPFGFSFRISCYELQAGLAFPAAVRWPTGSDEWAQGHTAAAQLPLGTADLKSFVRRAASPVGIF